MSEDFEPLLQDVGHHGRKLGDMPVVGVVEVALSFARRGNVSGGDCAIRKNGGAPRVARRKKFLRERGRKVAHEEHCADRFLEP